MNQTKITWENVLSVMHNIDTVKEYSLKNITKATGLLGNPQDRFKIIHVAGTNGKGSTSRMVFSILKQAGKQVGIFTSPHLCDIRERFETNTGQITKTEFLDILETIEQLDTTLTFFDKCVLIAFEFFALRKCEYVVLEVGMGGKYDTTNIVTPVATTITSISFDHENVLGNTLEEISEQKAGIIKKNVPIFVNFHNEVIEQTAKNMQAPLIFTTPKNTNLLWEHQKNNAGLAFAICKYLKIPEEQMLQWLQNVRHRGRLDFLEKKLLIDGAHNEDSLKKLSNFLQEQKTDFKKIQFCIALKKWKNISLIRDIFPDMQDIILVDVEHSMLEKIKILEQQCEEQGILYTKKTPQAIREQSQNEKDTLFVVFGSLYMVGRMY